MKPSIYIPEPRWPRGWLGEYIRERIKARRKAKSLQQRLEALKAKYAKA